MKLNKLAGATSEIWQVFIRDSSSTTGAGLTGLVFNSASLTAYYHRDTDTTATAITLVTMTVGTFTSSGFKEIDATNMPGWYQFCPPNAAIAAGAKSCAFHLKGATNMVPMPIEVQLTAVNPDSAAAFITGVNSLAPPTNWNLDSIDANGRRDIIKVAGTTQTARDLGGQLDATITSRMATFTLPTNFSSLAIDGSGKVVLQGVTHTGAVIPTVTTLTDFFTTANAEVTSIPAANAPPASKLSFVFAFIRNKFTQTSSTATLRNDGDSANIGTSASSDDGTTFIRAKWL
jgi:hypothetical protein